MPKITWICENGHEIEMEATLDMAVAPEVCEQDILDAELAFGMRICRSITFRRKYVAPALSFRGAGFYTTDNPKE